MALVVFSDVVQWIIKALDKVHTSRYSLNSWPLLIVDWKRVDAQITAFYFQLKHHSSYYVTFLFNDHLNNYTLASLLYTENEIVLLQMMTYTIARLKVGHDLKLNFNYDVNICYKFCINDDGRKGWINSVAIIDGEQMWTNK